jgi:hypothetical protein
MLPVEWYHNGSVPQFPEVPSHGCAPPSGPAQGPCRYILQLTIQLLKQCKQTVLKSKFMQEKQHQK